MKMVKKYSEGEIEALRKNPNVAEVRENRLMLTIEFRQRIYEAWILRPETSTIRQILEANGFDTQSLTLNFAKSIGRVFQRGGRPRTSRASPEALSAWDKSAYMPTLTAEELVESGRFIWDVNRLTFHPDYEAELYRKYPEQSIEDGLRAVGISPADVGYHKIYCLKEKFEKRAGRDTARTVKAGRRSGYNAETVRRYAKHPCVAEATRERIVLSDTFFNAARPIAALQLDELLTVFDIDPEDFTYTEKGRLRRKLDEWEKAREADVAEQLPREILRSRMKAMDGIIENELIRIGTLVPSMDVLARKKLCHWLRQLPADPGRKYTVKRILSLLGISRASYYAILNDEGYGEAAKEKAARDAEDAALIRQVMEYKGFAKGSRQIYMMMPGLTGRHLGLKKIRRLMKEHGIESHIRKPKNNKRRHETMLKKRVKPNLLQRRFKLHRPNEVRLTDVTYLDYGDGMRAYGSALLDPVTGRLIAFLVSENNDLALARETLRSSDSHPCVDGGMLHSDQGAVYLSGTFQKDVKALGLAQSMSKRGNCQDNAPQESFFGHFKDECSYSECESLVELQNLVTRYADYYNNERRMWDRGRMTPAEYEQYLLAMSEAEFSEYLAREEKKYQNMKERAANRAIERAKNLGV